VLKGGPGSERDVSLASAAGIVKTLRELHSRGDPDTGSFCVRSFVPGEDRSDCGEVCEQRRDDRLDPELDGTWADWSYGKPAAPD